MKYYKTTTKYNCGIDLHTKQMYACVMDREGNTLVHRNIKHNDFGFFLKLVEPYKDDLTVSRHPEASGNPGRLSPDGCLREPCSYR
jgi:hypothetical protein